MNKKLSILVVTVLFCLVSNGMAQATYYHFEDYRQTDVLVTASSQGVWNFDLDEDDLALWVIDYNPLLNNGEDWENAYRVPDGSMDEADILHRAYLTMRFCSANGDVIDLFFDNVLEWNDATISTGGTGKIDVYTQLYDDHILKVVITSVSLDSNTTPGTFTVDWMDLKGCYETGPVPVPEPGSMALLGVGLVALLAVVSRRKI